MSSWINDAAVQNHNGNGFPQMNDPNANVPSMMDPAAFMASGQFNTGSAQFANPQQMMAMQNGSMQNGPMRNASPSFHNPMYQTNSVIPSKRPRPREDGLSASPRQNTGMLPASRADTPQQAHFAAFPPGTLAQQNTPQYAHLPPNGSANATPSPILGNQIRSGSVPQRVSTTSPHPFSPATQTFAPQASPISSDPNPAPLQNPYTQGSTYPQGFNPNFTPTQSPARPSPNPPPAPGQMIPPHMTQMQQQMGTIGSMVGVGQATPVGPGNQMNTLGPMGPMGPMGHVGQMGQMGQMGQPPPHMFTPQMQQQLAQTRNPLEQQKLMYQMQFQRQLQQGNIQAGAQIQGQNTPPVQRNLLTRQPMSTNGQVPSGAAGAGKPPQQATGAGQPTGSRTNPDQFLSQLSVFMNRRSLPLDLNPSLGDRPVNLMVLFQAVQKFNGYRNVSQGNGWSQIAQALGFPPSQLPSAPAQIKATYERNLLKFEEFWSQSRAKATQQQQQQQQQPQAQHPPAHLAQHTQHSQPIPPSQDPTVVTTASKPAVHSQISGNQVGQPAQSRRSSSGQPQAPVKQNPPNGAHLNMNGFSVPPPPTNQPMNAQRGSFRGNVSRGTHGPTTSDDLAVQPSIQSKIGTTSTLRVQEEGQILASNSGTPVQGAPFADSDEYKPCSRESHTYGGIDVNAPGKIVSEILRFRPEVPAATELGNVDIHAMTRSIQSGIHGEVRLALDTLATVTVSGLPGLDIELDKCDDLLESLVEYAEELVEVLAENTVEVSDEILIPPYEDIARACQNEKLAIRDGSVTGTDEDELDKSVSYLLCTTTILRNLSFNLRNQPILADDTVIRFLCQMIRYVGTRNMLLRTQLNTLDFMKDIIIFLSNICASVELSDREQTFCLLQFLLAFAPTPLPSLSQSKVFFPAYQPSVQPYLPPAVDALAKLLARDEPNRSHFCNVFSADSSGLTPNDLLTRAFALAVSPIPEHVRETRPRHLPTVFEVRKPILMQGLLAADIVASLAPGYDSGVTKAWLNPDNGFAQNLYRSIRDLCRQFESVELHARNYRLRETPRKDGELMYIVVLGVSLLRKLTEKAVDPSNPLSLPSNALPTDDGLLEALEMISGEWSRDGFLQHLVAFASLKH